VQKSGSLLTNSLHTDLIFNISGGRHIAAALNTFGVGDETKRLLLACINSSEANWQCLTEAVQGDRVPVPEEGTIGDEATMKKAFKISSLELNVGSIADAALCRGALHER
jgi:EKC/KEOPS complex subunit CGI121/TPRKB